MSCINVAAICRDIVLSLAYIKVIPYFNLLLFVKCWSFLNPVIFMVLTALEAFRAGGAEDQRFIAKFSAEGGDATSLSDMYKLINKKGFKNIFLIEGDVRERFPEFLFANQHIRFSFAHLDMDVYEPTLCVLEILYEKIVKGGIIMFDDYNFVSGATKAIDEFLLTHQYLSIEKLPICHTPSFIMKPY